MIMLVVHCDDQLVMLLACHRKIIHLPGIRLPSGVNRQGAGPFAFFNGLALASFLLDRLKCNTPSLRYGLRVRPSRYEPHWTHEDREWRGQ